MARGGAFHAREDTTRASRGAAGSSITTPCLFANAKVSWCVGKGFSLTELETLRQSAMCALVEPTEARVNPGQARRSQKRIKDLEREVKRKDKALDETAALLVLTKKASAIFGEGADE